MITLHHWCVLPIAAYFVNLLLDYPLQCEFQKTYKSEYNFVLFIHSFIWGAGLFLFILWQLNELALWKLPMLVFGHMLIDAWKCRGWYKKCNLNDAAAYFIDQSLHVIQIVIVIYWQ